MNRVSWLQLASKLPVVRWTPISKTASRVAVKRQIKGIRQWSLNYEVIHGELPTREQQLAAAESWLRNTAGSLTLGKLTKQQIVEQVVVAEDQLAKYRSTAEQGVVLALPHLGNWDLAGAWSCAIGLPISSVAERLPAEDFRFFLELRSKLGMKIYAHDDVRVMEKLREDLAEGRVVALLADRDFSKRGISVKWKTRTGMVELTLPPGPAALASSTGSWLLPTATFFEGDLMRIEFGEPISPETSVEDATQQLADFFSDQVIGHTPDWHLMQRFFPGVVA